MPHRLLHEVLIFGHIVVGRDALAISISLMVGGSRDGSASGCMIGYLISLCPECQLPFGGCCLNDVVSKYKNLRNTDNKNIASKETIHYE